MIWLTGDTHGHFDRVEAFCREQQTTTDDILIILGDSGFNFGGERDRFLKTRASQFPITIFSLHGNRENRPPVFLPAPAKKRPRQGRSSRRSA